MKFTYADNSTYSINLSESWTNGTVILNEIYSKAPSLENQALWMDGYSESFYAFDGGINFFIPEVDQPIPPNQLWQFTPSEDSGNWSQVSFPPSSNFTSLVRVSEGIYAFGAGLGFALGGQQGRSTSSVLSEFIPAPGMVMHNFTSREWYNVSASGYSNSGVALYGVAHFVPNFGSIGLFFVFEGMISGDVLPGTDFVSMFDPASQQWSSQEVSGTKPSPVLNPCIVGIQGDENTYEVSHILTELFVKVDGIMIDFFVRRAQRR